MGVIGSAPLKLLTKKENQRAGLAWQLLLPTLIALACVAGWPLLKTFYYSFTDATFATLDNSRWVGFNNYALLFNEEDWWRSVWNTLYFTVISVGIETVLGLGIALLLNENFKGRGMLRAATLIPWAIPTIVSAKMWSWMYNDIYGILNHALVSLGLITENLAWTADSSLAMWAVIITDVWKTTPFMTLLLLAGLQSISRDCYESAKMDGANAWTTFWHVTLPLLRPALIVAMLFRSLDALRIFDLVYVLTPNMAETMTISVFARQQMIEFQEIGVGSAASVFLFFMVAAVGCLYFILTRKSV